MCSSDLELLTDALAAYRGALLVVSHDERFLEEIGVERTLDLTPGSRP